jgi:hypothetical protein
MGEISREGAKLVSEAPREGEAATGKKPADGNKNNE